MLGVAQVLSLPSILTFMQKTLIFVYLFIIIYYLAFY